MENIVSARRLRKSMLNNAVENSNYTYDENIKEKYKINFKNKVLIQSLVSSIILFLTIFLVNNYKESLTNNYVINRLYQHYKFDFSKELILNNFEESIRSLNNIMGDIVPINIKNKIVSIYNDKIKYFIITFDLKNVLKYDEKQVEIYIYEQNELKGIENKTNEINIYYNNDKSLNEMSLIKPTLGIITSKFGMREKIFDEIGNYHKGIDIANEIGTEIVSSSDGIVSKIVYNDKYFGNYIEITEGKVKFKYAHLNEILVNENEYIMQNQTIGKMGSTGMSTGSHLHFEIKENESYIDPMTVIDFDEI